MLRTLAPRLGTARPVRRDASPQSTLLLNLRDSQRRADSISATTTAKSIMLRARRRSLFAWAAVNIIVPALLATAGSAFADVLVGVPATGREFVAVAMAIQGWGHASSARHQPPRRRRGARKMSGPGRSHWSRLRRPRASDGLGFGALAAFRRLGHDGRGGRGSALVGTTGISLPRRARGRGRPAPNATDAYPDRPAAATAAATFSRIGGQVRPGLDEALAVVRADALVPVG